MVFCESKKSTFNQFLAICETKILHSSGKQFKSQIYIIIENAANNFSQHQTKQLCAALERSMKRKY